MDIDLAELTGQKERKHLELNGMDIRPWATETPGDGQLPGLKAVPGSRSTTPTERGETIQDAGLDGSRGFLANAHEVGEADPKDVVMDHGFDDIPRNPRLNNHVRIQSHSDVAGVGNAFSFDHVSSCPSYGPFCRLG